MDEVWKPVLGFEGSYTVSNLGRVKSLERHCRKGGGGWRTVPEKILQPTRWGRYWSVNLAALGKVRRRRVHELVLTAFVSQRPKGKQCCHNDGNVDNNELTNLRWGTKKENEADKIVHGTNNIGERNGNSKLTDDQVIQIYFSTKPHKDISEEFSVSKMWVSMIKNRKRWGHLTKELPNMGRDMKMTEEL